MALVLGETGRVKWVLGNWDEEPGLGVVDECIDNERDSSRGSSGEEDVVWIRRESIAILMKGKYHS
jgi:hypothetical protein